jgi:chemotaxis-related protein WspD
MIDDCWNKIGVRGDGSCPQLKEHAHCHNCPVYAAAAADLLRAVPPDDSLAERTRHFAQPKQVEEGGTHSIVIFRIWNEWLALAAGVVKEVANPRPVHSLPHRTNDMILGVANVRGELLIAASLGAVLGLDASQKTDRSARGTAYPRWLVLRRDDVRAVCPVDEVHGVHRLHPKALKEVPATLAKASTRYSTNLLAWNGHSIGVIDDQLLFYTLRRSVA